MKRRLFEYVVLPAAMVVFLLGAWLGGGQRYAESIQAEMVTNTQAEAP